MTESTASSGGERRGPRIWLRVLVVLTLLAVAVVGLFALRIYTNPLAAFERSSRRTLAGLGLERKEMSAPSGTLVFWEGGSGSPLVLVPGAGDQAGTRADVARSLVDDHRLLIVDLPGHGESDPAEGPLTAEQLYAGLEAFLDAHLDPPPVVAGNSLGGWLTMVYAHRHPGALARVVVINGGALRSDLGGYSLLPRNREEARHLVEGLRDAASPKIPDFILDDIVDRSADGSVARMMGDLDGLNALVLDDRLGEITDPVDVIWGTSDKLMPLSYAERMVAALPRARLSTLPHCGHIPQNECPDRLVTSLRELLAAGPPPLPAPAAEREPR